MTRITQRFVSHGVAVLLIGLFVPTSAFAAFIPTLDDVVLSNANGDLYVIKATDFNINYTDGGFGNVTGVQVTSGNLVLVSNSNGDLRLRTSDLASNVVPAADLGDSISTLGLRADGVGFVAGDLGAGGRIGLLDGGGYLAGSPDGGYGTIGPNAVGFQSNGNVVLGSSNGTGTVYTRDGVTLNGVQSDGGYGTVAIAVQSNDRIVAGNTTGTLYIRGSNPNIPIESDGGFGNIVEIRVLANDNLVVASNSGGDAFVRIREGNDQNADLNDIGGIAAQVFTNKTITAIALQSNGNIVAGFSDGNIFLLQQSGGGFITLTDNGGYGVITDLAVFHAIPEPSCAILSMIAVPFVARRLRRSRRQPVSH